MGVDRPGVEIRGRFPDITQQGASALDATRPALQGERMALEWLEEHWTVDKSPGGGQHLYYLYGIERVGALYQTEFFGPHEWYRDGDRYHLKNVDAFRTLDLRGRVVSIR